MLPKWQIDKMASWHNATLTRLHVAKVKNRQNGKQTKWKMEKMTC